MAEYIWLDGKKPTPSLRSKTKILEIGPDTKFERYSLSNIPVWGFDGSSTEQAAGNNSDCVLKPVAFFYDPLRNNGAETFPHLLVLNQVFIPQGEPHPSNTRINLEQLVEEHQNDEFWFGIEQEYTFFKDGRPLGFPASGEPEPQGKYYCGIGADRAFGREIVEEHMQACLQANLLFAGINAEVMPGQWEYQIGSGAPLQVADHLIIARYLMERLAEKYGVVVSLSPKPKEDGDWNGAGAHTNFSTKAMREGLVSFEEIILKLKAKHQEHITIYGPEIEKRLTGKHETCDYRTFRSGISDRGASIRIPWQVHLAGKGYLEDRRPCANIDPYEVVAKIIKTIKE